MSFASVLKSLQELFPQVDRRILKAVAIEHRKDVDAAVDFILNDVLPSVPSPSLYPDVGSVSSGQIRIEEHRESVQQQVAHKEANSGFSDLRSPSSEHSEGNQDSDGRSPYLGEELTTPPELRSITSGEYGSHHTLEVPHGSSTCLDELVPSPVLNSQLFLNNGTAELTSSEANPENESNGLHKDSHLVPTSTTTDEDIVFFDCNNKTPTTIQDLNEPAAYETNLSVLSDRSDVESHTNMVPSETVDSCVNNEANELVKSPSQSEAFSTASNITERLVQETEDEGKELVEDASENEISSSANKNTEQVVEETEGDSFSTPVYNDTQSGQICQIDVLEDAINEAKNNKKTLFSSMDSVIKMMREVEDLEKAAEYAKQEAVKGGQDILLRVEELRKMLLHAKEANDMHAGEVYGEKAILATEARELQSRLLNLSYERDRSLSILDEMSKALEARVVAAEEIRKAAELEKLDKEDSARKFLIEQELIMENVVQESKRLQTEAEENSKLREFLMDRGHIVDTLQGEIAVICKDVKLLKENFDSREPLSKSLSSSQTSCILASSGSSSGKSLDSNPVQEQFLEEFFAKRIIGDDENGTLFAEVLSKSGSDGGYKKVVDDDWELLSGEREF